MESKVVKIEAMRFAGYLLQTKMDEVMKDNPLPRFWGALSADGRFEKLMQLESDCPASYGATLMHNEQDMDYTVSRALPAGADAPEGLHVVDMPAGEYIEVKTTLENLHAAFGFINNWMEENGYTWAHGGSFEMYPEDYMQTKILNLYAPIAKK